MLGEKSRKLSVTLRNYQKFHFAFIFHFPSGTDFQLIFKGGLITTIYSLCAESTNVKKSKVGYLLLDHSSSVPTNVASNLKINSNSQSENTEFPATSSTIYNIFNNC